MQINVLNDHSSNDKYTSFFNKLCRRMTPVLFPDKERKLT